MVPENKNIRIKFAKTGALQFISHLDLCRTMKTAFVRAGVPIWYSEGFNPHPKMVFALPLSVGTQSICEYLDIKITGDMPAAEIAERLDATTPPELKIMEAYEPETKFSDICWAQYRVGFYGKNISAARELFSKPLIVTKHTKNGEKQADILPSIKFLKIEGDVFEALLSASNEGYLNPEYPASAIAEHCAAPDYEIVRQNLYLADGVTPFG